MKRKPILITSSALHGWRNNYVAMGEYEGDELHMDTIGIPGGTIHSLMRAFLAELGPYRGPVDVILVCGLNDVKQGANLAMLKDALLTFKHNVMNRDDNSTFAMATLYLPPKMCVLGNEDESIIQGVNKYELIVDFNKYIKLQNMMPGQKLDTSRCPQFHSWGLRSRQPTAEERAEGNEVPLQRCQSYRFEQWREPQRSEMLHLSDRLRFKMGKAVLHYFRCLYGLEPHSEPEEYPVNN